MKCVRRQKNTTRPLSFTHHPTTSLISLNSSSDAELAMSQPPQVGQPFRRRCGKQLRNAEPLLHADGIRELRMGQLIRT
jgi:hypothetical protein